MPWISIVNSNLTFSLKSVNRCSEQSHFPRIPSAYLNRIIIPSQNIINISPKVAILGNSLGHATFLMIYNSWIDINKYALDTIQHIQH